MFLLRFCLALGMVAIVAGSSAACSSGGLEAEASVESEARAAPRPVEDLVVVSVIDGDTVSVKRAGSSRPVRVRLLSIDAPETEHGNHEAQEPWASESMRALKELLPAGTNVTLQTPGADVHGRFLSRILRRAPSDPSGGLDVNLELVRLGAAFPFAFCRPTSACKLTDLRRGAAPDFARACTEAKAARRAGGIFDRRRPL